MTPGGVLQDFDKTAKLTVGVNTSKSVWFFVCLFFKLQILKKMEVEHERFNLLCFY